MVQPRCQSEFHCSEYARLIRMEESLINIDKCLRGNGDRGLKDRVKNLEDLHLSQNTVFWRFLTPALPVLYGAVFAYLMKVPND